MKKQKQKDKDFKIQSLHSTLNRKQETESLLSLTFKKLKNLSPIKKRKIYTIRALIIAAFMVGFSFSVYLGHYHGWFAGIGACRKLTCPSGETRVDMVGYLPSVCANDEICDSRCPSQRLVGTVEITTPGYYTITATGDFNNSYTEQKNESFYLVVENSDGTLQPATDGNAGDYYVVQDPNDGTKRHTKPAGTYYFDQGKNKIYMKHYALIDDEYPGFLNGPMGECESLNMYGLCLKARKVVIQSDFGDAPASYGDAQNDIVPGVQLGALVDAESGTQYSENADGDDSSGQDDEDGVAFDNEAHGQPGEIISVTVTGLTSKHRDDFLSAWIDFNRNGIFDHPAEQIINADVFYTDPNPQTRGYQFEIPLDAQPGKTYARFRYQSDPTNPTQYENSGETEDYIFVIDEIIPTYQLELSKQVRLSGSSDTFADSITVDYASDVEYQFTLTNTGDADLTTITLSDPDCDSGPSLISGDDNADNTLQTTETWVYSCSKLGLIADLTNTATADSDETESVTDTAEVTVGPPPPTPAIAIKKTVSHNPDGAYSNQVTLISGNTAYYKIQVSNSGNMVLDNISVTDDQCTPNYISGDDNANNQLDLSETWLYTCSTENVTQDIINTATADSDETDSVTDTAEVVVQSLGLNIIKEVSQNLSGPLVKELNLLSGSSAYYQIQVSNTGDVVLTNITLTDDQCTPIYISGDDNSDNQLDVSEIWIYTCSLENITQSLTNTATANSDETAPVTDTAQVNILVAGLNLSKQARLAGSTNAFADSITVDYESDVEYQFTLTNTGDADLTNITLVDPDCDSDPVLQSGDDNTDNILQTTETWIYSCSKLGLTEDLTNTATADSQETDPVTDTAEVIVNQPTILELTINKTVSDSADGTYTHQITLVSGSTAYYRIIIDNSGDVVLTNLVVTDDHCTPNYLSGDDNTNSQLDVNETWTYTCSLDNVTQNLTNTATADSDQTDPLIGTAQVIVQAPGLNILKQVRLSGSTDPYQNSITVDYASDVEYQFTLTNTGQADLTAITLSDPDCDSDPVLVSGDDNTDNTLQTTETWIYSCSKIGLTTDLVNTATADSQETDPVTDTAEVVVNQPTPGLNLLKQARLAGSTNAFADSITVDYESDVEYQFTLTNTGDADLTNITLVDPDCDSDPVLQSGDDNTDNILQTTETWIYSCSKLGLTEDLTNTATADSQETDSVSDTAQVSVNPATPGLNLSKQVRLSNSQEAFADSITVDYASDVEYQFTLTNTGDADLTTITLSDPDCDQDPVFVSGDDNTDNTLQTTETWVYSCSKAGLIEDLTNTATADSAETDSVTDTAGVTVNPPATPGLTVDKAVSQAVDGTYTDQLILISGSTAYYRIVVSNTGDVVLTNISLTDDQCTPGYISGDDNTDNQLDTSEAWIYICSLENLTQGVINTATADSDQTDPITDVAEVIIQAPGLNLSKQVRVQGSQDTFANSITVDYGSDVEYQFTLTNTGEADLTTITLSDPDCDSGPSLISGDDNADNILQTTETWVYSCSKLGLIEDLTNTATADSQETDSVTDTAEVVIGQPHISITKLVSDGDQNNVKTNTAYNDENMIYHLEYANNGNGTALNATIIDDYDQSKITILNPNPNKDDGDKITWSLGDLAPGQNGTILINVKTNNNLSDGTRFINSATIYSDNDSLKEDRVTTTIYVPIIPPPPPPPGGCTHNCGGGGGSHCLGKRSPVADVGGNRTVYIGQKIRLDASDSSDADGDRLDFYWDTDRSDGIQIPYDLTGEVVDFAGYDQVGTFEVTLRVEDSCGFTLDIIKITVKKLPPPPPEPQPEPEPEPKPEPKPKLIVNPKKVPATGAGLTTNLLAGGSFSFLFTIVFTIITIRERKRKFD